MGSRLRDIAHSVNEKSSMTTDEARRLRAARVRPLPPPRLRARGRLLRRRSGDRPGVQFNRHLKFKAWVKAWVKDKVKDAFRKALDREMAKAWVKAG